MEVALGNELVDTCGGSLNRSSGRATGLFYEGSQFKSGSGKGFPRGFSSPYIKSGFISTGHLTESISLVVLTAPSRHIWVYGGFTVLIAFIGF